MARSLDDDVVSGPDDFAARKAVFCGNPVLHSSTYFFRPAQQLAPPANVDYAGASSRRACQRRHMQVHVRQAAVVRDLPNTPGAYRVSDRRAFRPWASHSVGSAVRWVAAPLSPRPGTLRSRLNLGPRRPKLAARLPNLRANNRQTHHVMRRQVHARRTAKCVRLFGGLRRATVLTSCAAFV